MKSMSLEGLVSQQYEQYCRCRATLSTNDRRVTTKLMTLEDLGSQQYQLHEADTPHDAIGEVL